MRRFPLHSHFSAFKLLKRPLPYFAVFGVVALGGCFWRDDDALFEKLREECSLSPPMPICCSADDDCARGVYDDFFARSVTTAEEQECILSARCELDDGSIDVQPVLECFAAHDDDGFDVLSPKGVPDEECAAACTDITDNCSDGLTCNLDEARVCIADEERCVDTCR